MRTATPFVCLAGTFMLAAAASAEQPVPGQRFDVRPADMPPPYLTSSARNPSRLARRSPGASLQVPPGFRVTIFAEGLAHPRNLVVAEDGAVFLAQSRAGEVTLLRDDDGNGAAEIVRPFISGLLRPHGLALHGGFLYVADSDFVRRYPVRAGADAPAGPAEILTPARAFGAPGGHWTRNLALSADGTRIYVAIGSTGNISVDPEPRATVQVFEAGRQRTLAAGLRNPVGIAVYPGTEDVYVVVNERDGLGDELVPDYLTRIREGEFFGWPYAYIGNNPQPGQAELRPDLVAKSQVPDVLFQSHSAPLGLVFYDGEQFPAEYRGDAFVALHGSWNAAEPRGYMVARVPFEDGRPLGWYEAFATGFWAAGTATAVVIGRPAGVAVAADGALLVADDAGGRVWRISYSP